MNKDDFHTTTTIAHVPKKARKSYLNVCGQHNADQTNQDRVGDPSDLGRIALIPDKHNGRPKNNRLNQETNTDVFRTPTTIVPVPKKARQSYLAVFGQHNADQGNQDHVGDSSDLGPTILIPDIFPNYNDRPKNNRPKYDPDLLLRKRMILSNDVTKTTLVKHDERPNESNTNKDVVDDETFFENLKKRISKDLQNNILSKTPNRLPKRLPKARQCKSLLNNETRSLMNNFRREFANSQSQKLLSQENGVFSMTRRSNSSTREEDPDSAMPDRAVERGMTKDMLEHHETDDDSLRGTPSFHESHAEVYNHQPTPSSLERNRVFSMKRQGNSWTGENISEHPHSAMTQNVVKRGMTKDISMKYSETDEDSLHGRTSYNEFHAEAHNRPWTPSASERNSMKRRDTSSTGEYTCEHQHQVMPQKIVGRRMTKDISMKYFETDEDALRGRQPFNEIHAEIHNRQLSPSPSERNGVFSIKRRSSTWTRGNIHEHPRPATPQSVMEHKPIKDILWEPCGTDEDSVRNTLTFNEMVDEVYNRQPTASSLERNRAFLMENQRNNSTRESVCEHPHSAMAQNVVERGLTKDIMFEYFQSDKASLHRTPSFNEIHTEPYDRQPISSSSASNTFVKYYTKYYQRLP